MRLLIAALVALGGCTIEYVPCTLRCAPESRACPSGFTCGADTFCHTAGDVQVTCSPDLSTDPGDLAGADFTGADLAGLDFSEADLSGFFEGWRILAASKSALADETTCGIRGNGSLWCWGTNEQSTLGINSGAIATGVPGQVGTDRDWVAVAVGDGRACAIRQNGAGRLLYCWGANRPLAQVGSDNDWATVDVSFNFQCGIRQEPGGRKLYCWGDNAYGELGDLTELARPLPTPVAVPGADWAEVHLGERFGCARRASGEVWCWGYDNIGQVGVPGDGGAPPPDLANSGLRDNVRPPTQLPGAWDGLATGRFHGCARAGGRVFCWGQSAEGQCGTVASSVKTPTEIVAAPTDVTEVTAAGVHSCILRAGGLLQCFGWNAFGQLGSGTLRTSATPMTVPMGGGWMKPWAGGTHTCALRNEVGYCWGSSDWGELGDGRVGIRLVATRSGTSTGWSALSAGGQHACAIAAGMLSCWGSNDVRQVNPTLTPDQPRFVPTVLGGLGNVFAVDTGADSTCALTGTGGMGTLHCFGNPLIDGTGAQYQVGSVADWQRVSVGSERACALRAGELWCWGENSGGQLADGTMSDVASPKRIGTDATWTAVSVGDLVTCGIKAGGLYCWDPPLGVLFGTSSNGRVGSDGDWTAVSVGGAHGCGIRDDGVTKSLWCFGAGAQGQRGNGFNLSSATPAREATLGTDWRAVSAGRYATCALHGGNGDLYCWGLNSTGQLGDGTLTSQNVPTRVAGLTTAQQIAAGELSSCALQAAGELWCWGAATHGQLGDDYGSRLQPVKVLDP